MFHPEVEYSLGKERAAQIRREVEHNRLGARLLVREARSCAEQAPAKGVFHRGATLVVALLR